MEFINYLIVMYTFLLSPGPSMTLIARNSAKFGIQKTFPTILGITTSILLYTSLSVIGIATIASIYPQSFKIFKFAGSLYIICLGIKIFMDSFNSTDKDITSNTKKTSKFRQYLIGLTTDVANPLSLIGITSIILGFVKASDSLFIKGIYSIFTVFSTFACAYTYAFIFGNKISRKFITPRMENFEKITGIAICSIGCIFLINTVKL